LTTKKGADRALGNAGHGKNFVTSTLKSLLQIVKRQL